MNKGTGFAFGLLVGVIVGLLVAPRSGEETRERIREKKDRFIDETGEVVDRVRGKVREGMP